MDAQLMRSQGDGLSFQPAAVLPALRSNLHFWVTGIAMLALFPALVHLHLPLVWPWRFVVEFTGSVAQKSLFVAAVLYVIGRPAELRVVATR